MQWQLKQKAPEEFLNKFPEVNNVILELLYQRGVREEKEIEKFLDPDYCRDLYDPFLMSGMDKAVKRIIAAINPPAGEKEKIAVFGDYDADGVCASALVIESLKMLGADAEAYIPDREKEGYGMSAAAIEELAGKGVKLIITVDCGISNFNEVELAKEKGIDVIVTDHHPPVQKIPKAYAVIDPKQEGDEYPFKDLAGVGVAYKLICALFKKIPPPLEGLSRQSDAAVEGVGGGFSLQNFGGVEGYLKWCLDIVALGTVADVCPLIDENRTITKYGLIVLEKNRRIGLAELLKQAKLHDGQSQLSLNSHNIGYQIGPRLNASGRMDHANTSFQLLITQSKIEAADLAFKIEEKNTRRQQLTKQIINKIKSDFDFSKEDFIFAHLEECPAGIAGLVAGKLTDEFLKPSFIISEKEEIAKGSCRAPDCFAEKGFHLGNLLSGCKDYLEKFGGHAQAAGFSVKKENIAGLKEKIKEIFKSVWKNKLPDIKPCLEIDSELSHDDINWDLLEQIKKMAPFGEGNPQPIFSIKNASAQEPRLVGNGEKHLKLTLRLKRKDGTMHFIDAIAFGFGQLGINAGDEIDAAFNLEENFWNGSRSLQLNIKDIKKC